MGSKLARIASHSLDIMTTDCVEGSIPIKARQLVLRGDSFTQVHIERVHEPVPRTLSLPPTGFGGQDSKGRAPDTGGVQSSRTRMMRPAMIEKVGRNLGLSMLLEENGPHRVDGGTVPAA